MSNSTLFGHSIVGIMLAIVFGSASAVTLDQDQSSQNHANQLQATHYPLPVQFRNSLVEPYLEQVQIKGRNTSDTQQVMKVLIMADDLNGAKIYFNQASKKFGLAHYQPGERAFTYTKNQELNSLGEAFKSLD